MSWRDNIQVLAIDPGSEHVGWSKASGSDVSTDFGIDSPNVFHERFEKLPAFRAVDRVAIERFDLRQFTDESQLTVEVIGVIKWLWYKKGITIGYVNASDKRKNYKRVHDAGLRSHAADAEAIRLWDLDYGKW